jgi:hypothetical protein
MTNKPTTTTKIKPTISPFLQMEVEQKDWQGYNANLVDEAIARGLQLEEENKKFRDFSPKEARRSFWSNWGTFGGIMGCLAIVGAFVLFVVWVSLAMSNGTKYNEGFKAGEEASVAAAIAYVEGQYRHVSPDQIRLEFPHGTDVFNKDSWIARNQGSNETTSDTFERYQSLLKEGGAYKIFITPQK